MLPAREVRLGQHLQPSDELQLAVAPLPGVIPKGGTDQAQDAADSPPRTQTVRLHDLSHLFLVCLMHIFFL
jgi:hypothetical protein